MVVLDEADRMFDMGFEYQVRSVVQNVRPNRQTLLFSATFPPKIEILAREILKNPVRITIGEVGQANENVAQTVHMVKSEADKWPWVSEHMEKFQEAGQVLIFANSIASCNTIERNFKDLLGTQAEVLHGDMDQDSRMRIISAFRKEKAKVLIATDVAARGLDITTIRTVVNYDMARDIETHTHRIGRTGRAGATGEAHTLFIEEDQNKKTAALLCERLEQAKQPVDARLKALAMKFEPYKAAQALGKSLAETKGKGDGKGKGKGKGGKGKKGNAKELAAAFDMS